MFRWTFDGPCSDGRSPGPWLQCSPGPEGTAPEPPDRFGCFCSRRTFFFLLFCLAEQVEKIFHRKATRASFFFLNSISKKNGCLLCRLRGSEVDPQVKLR
ncbi:hypothetical protein CEXT_679131 [Caerostris extrusa]|uniref:Uncharacterized protein n=1 Tax=Caerostris extrusa TaxID=172846 RepID=A0AAV4SND9_CAEEX|nr:hypothetical protein CEXT_679131 [Caerostris extrusa]